MAVHFWSGVIAGGMVDIKVVQTSKNLLRSTIRSFNCTLSAMCDACYYQNIHRAWRRFCGREKIVGCR